MAEIRATPQQRAAAEDRGGALLVAAAAGSGKTKVLVDRLMGYLTDPTDPADLDEFLSDTREIKVQLKLLVTLDSLKLLQVIQHFRILVRVTMLVSHFFKN